MPDLLSLLPPDLLPLGLPLLSLDLPLLLSVEGGRRRVVGWGWEANGQWWRREARAKERGRAKARGRPNRRRVEAVAAARASWIGGDSGLGEVAVRERVREREEWVRELKK